MNIVFDMVLSDGWMMICAVFTLLTYVLYRFAKNDSDVSSEAKKPYACGLSVDPDTQKLPSASFYKTVISVFK
ncbi:MAG: hypothetical protein U9P44_03130, partial [archaeon]|nr:hypothetical protein [archaeon]